MWRFARAARRVARACVGADRATDATAAHARGQSAARHAQEAGFDGVEIPVFGGEPADYKPLRAELDKNGLKCTTVTIQTAETNAVSPDE